MKKILLVPVLMSFLLLPTIVLAQDPWPTITSPQDFIDRLDIIARWLMTILFVVAAIFIVAAAYRFVTSGGDPASVASARQSLLYALVGVAVAVLAWALVQIVKNIIIT